MLNHFFDNLNDINDKDTHKQDTPLSLQNFIMANLTQAVSPILTFFYSLKLFILTTEKLELKNGLRTSKELVVSS